MLQVGTFLHLKQQLLIVILNILYMYLLEESDARYQVTLENVYLSTQMVEKTCNKISPLPQYCFVPENASRSVKL